MNPKVDKFLKEAKHWRQEMTTLRRIILKTHLQEDYKWSKPCYSYKGNNVAIIQPFKHCLGMMFFKGALLKDKKEMLVKNGPHSQAGRRFEFRSEKDIQKLESTIKSYVKEAIVIEQSGKQIEFKKAPEPMPEELKKMFAQKPGFKKAFSALTPGRQRAYILHFVGAKLASTRQSRIQKCIPQILQGRGINDR